MLERLKEAEENERDAKENDDEDDAETRSEL